MRIRFSFIRRKIKYCDHFIHTHTLSHASTYEIWPAVGQSSFYFSSPISDNKQNHKAQNEIKMLFKSNKIWIAVVHFRMFFPFYTNDQFGWYIFTNPANDEIKKEEKKHNWEIESHNEHANRQKKRRKTTQRIHQKHIQSNFEFKLEKEKNVWQSKKNIEKK